MLNIEVKEKTYCHVVGNQSWISSGHLGTSSCGEEMHSLLKQHGSRHTTGLDKADGLFLQCSQEIAVISKVLQ